MPKSLALGEALKAARVRRGMTQRDVAKQLNFTASYLSQVEKARTVALSA
jgi:transcriptional regulator with XRE-family HTH domain